MSKAKFAAARELIREKRYDEARTILQTIDHPKAQEWEWRLDDLEAKGKPSGKKRVVVVQQKKGGRGCFRTLVYIFIAGVVVSVVLASLVPSQDSNDEVSSLPTTVTDILEALVVEVTIVESPLPITTTLPTATATTTASATVTETPLPTATITDTPLPTEIPLPTNTPTRETIAETVVRSVIGQNTELQSFVVNDLVVTVRYPLTDLSAGMARRQAERDFAELACALREAGFATQTFQFTGTIGLIDAFGNAFTGEGVEMILEAGTAARMNCAEPFFIDLSAIAERYDVHRLLQE